MLRCGDFCGFHDLGVWVIIRAFDLELSLFVLGALLKSARAYLGINVLAALD